MTPVRTDTQHTAIPMDLIHVRFPDTVFASLAHIREQHARFQRLLVDRPTGIRIKTRAKNPEVDLKASYNRRFAQSSAASVVLCLAFFFLYPEHHPTVSLVSVPKPFIRVQNIPETTQRMRPPPPPRPSVPLAVEGEEVPEDVTIESTELDLDMLPDLMLQGPIALGPMSDEPLDISEIDSKPIPIRIATPEYPRAALKAKREGTVRVRILVNKIGNVEEVEFLKGPEIFRKAAVTAANQYRYRPGKHQGHKRKVWAIIDIEFKLN